MRIFSCLKDKYTYILWEKEYAVVKTHLHLAGGYGIFLLVYI